jgi:RES domain-containing protein
MLEYFVHLDQDDPPRDLVLAVAEIPYDLTRERIDPGNLPGNWRDAAPPPELVRFGDEFVQRGEHCLLVVPSALAPTEHNCLINPAHPDYKRIGMREVEPLSHDPRMFRKGRGRGRH